MLNLRLPLARLSRAAEAGSPTRRSSRRSPPAWRDDVAADVRRRPWAVPWRPMLAEGLIGSGQLEQTALVLDQPLGSLPGEVN